MASSKAKQALGLLTALARDVGAQRNDRRNTPLEGGEERWVEPLRLLLDYAEGEARARQLQSVAGHLEKAKRELSRVKPRKKSQDQGGHSPKTSLH